MKSGILLINKPSNMTSNQVVQIVKRTLKVHKVGHAGTLDPLATGLMVVLINEATKLSDYILTNDKEYYVEMQLFCKTTTGDLDGEVLVQASPRTVSEQEIKTALMKFDQQTYNQIPPIYSAIKYQGKKLYQYARQAIEITPQPRMITINKISYHSFDKKQNIISFTVNCSKGTYIRSLVEDIAEQLQTVAMTTKLVRIKSGNFTLQEAHLITEINNKNIISLYDILKINKQPIIEVSNELINSISHGQKIMLPGVNQKVIFLITKTKKVLGIYYLQSDNVFACQRLFNEMGE